MPAFGDARPGAARMPPRRGEVQIGEVWPRHLRCGAYRCPFRLVLAGVTDLACRGAALQSLHG